MLTLSDPLPSGWHEIYGESSKTALMWSLASLRDRERLTVLVLTGQIYDYRKVAFWAGIPTNQVLVITTYSNLLEVVIDLCSSGEVAQVIFEDLGFLIGSGKLLPETEKLLGDITGLFTLTGLAQENDIAYYVSSYSVSSFMSPPALGKERPLGGRVLEELSTGRRLRTQKKAYLRGRSGKRIGERFSLENLLTGEECQYDILYEQGPVRPR
jgi:hypothetical protein